MIKVPENGREGFYVEVGAKVLLAVFSGSFPKRGVHKVKQACKKLCSGGFLKNPSLWRVQGPSKPKIC